MRILSFRKFEKNSLKGFIEAELPSGMVLKDLTWHQKGDREWIGLPARKFEKDDGSTSWANVVDFATKELYWKFTKQLLTALKKHLGQE